MFAGRRNVEANTNRKPLPMLDALIALKHEIIREALKALKRFADDDIDLLCIIGSYGDTLPDEDILSLLREWNAGKSLLNEVQ